MASNSGAYPSQRAYPKYKWPPYATEWKFPHENFLRTPLRETIIKSVFDYRFNSNKHTHMFSFVTQAFCVFLVRICFIFGVQSGFISITEWEPCMWLLNTDILAGLLLSEFVYPLLGHTRFRDRCWAAIRLSYRPEPSGRAVLEEVDEFDTGGPSGRRFVLLRHTHRRPYPICKQERKPPTPVWRR